MARKSSNNSSGCATVFGGIIVVGFLIAIISYVAAFVFVGAMYFVPLLLLYEFIFYFTHRKPLTYEQVKKLSHGRAKKYIKSNYKFKKGTVPVDPNFKSSLNVTGRWYEIEERLDAFPAYIASLLKGKHHEWVVIAIEKNGLICNFWANKGEDNQSVSFSCDINDIIRKCKQVGGYSVLRFHNHPNSDPQHYTTLLASEQDKISAKSCSEIVCKEGINWFDFVCARGDFIQFYGQVSDEFQLDGAGVSDIIDKISITPSMDYKLQNEYRRVSGRRKIEIILIALIAALLAAFSVAGKSSNAPEDLPNSTDAETYVETEPISKEEWVYPELDDFEYEYRNGGITLSEYKGTASSIVIPASYTVENTNLPVLKLDQTFRYNKKVRNVVISEGINTISSNTFYNCPSLKRLYIPSTLTYSSSTLSDIKEGEILYYGGTQEEWVTFKGGNLVRSDIGFAKIVVNASMDEALDNINVLFDMPIPHTDESYAPLSDFSYDVENGGITLKKYSGRSKFVSIAPAYYSDGIEYPVFKLDNTFAVGRVDTVIVPEGITTLTQATFNSCGVTVLYLPSTLSDVPSNFWGYFHNVDTIYYGGTEVQFQELCLIDRWDIDVKHMVYDASPDDVSVE